MSTAANELAATQARLRDLEGRLAALVEEHAKVDFVNRTVQKEEMERLLVAAGLGHTIALPGLYTRRLGLVTEELERRAATIATLEPCVYCAAATPPLKRVRFS